MIQTYRISHSWIRIREVAEEASEWLKEIEPKSLRESSYMEELVDEDFVMLSELDVYIADFIDNEVESKYENPLEWFIEFEDDPDEWLWARWSGEYYWIEDVWRLNWVKREENI